MAGESVLPAVDHRAFDIVLGEIVNILDICINDMVVDGVYVVLMDIGVVGGVQVG